MLVHLSIPHCSEPFLLRLESDWAPALIVNPAHRAPALVVSQFGLAVPDRREALRELFGSKPSPGDTAAAGADGATAAGGAGAGAAGGPPRSFLNASSAVMEAAFTALPPPPALVAAEAAARKGSHAPITRRGPLSRADRASAFAAGTPPRLSLGTCAACGHAFCGECSHSWHGGVACTMRLRTPADAVVQAARIQALTGVPAEHALIALSRPPAAATAASDADDDTGRDATPRGLLRAGVTHREHGAAPTNAARFLAQKDVFGSEEGAEAATGALWRGAGTIRDIDFDPWAASAMWRAAARAGKRARMDETQALREALLIATTTRACPRCKALVARVSGCRHMVCVCGMPFCFDCGESRSSGPCSCERGDGSRSRVAVDERSVTDILKRM